MVDANHHEEKRKDEDVPSGLETDGERRVGREALHELFGGDVEMHGHVERKSNFHYEDAGEGEAEEKEEFADTPGRTNVFREVFLRRARRRRERELRERGGRRFGWGFGF